MPCGFLIAVVAYEKYHWINKFNRIQCIEAIYYYVEICGLGTNGRLMVIIGCIMDIIFIVGGIFLFSKIEPTRW